MTKWILFDLGNTLIQSPSYEYRNTLKRAYLTRIFETLEQRDLIQSDHLNSASFSSKVLKLKNDATLLEDTCYEVIQSNSDSVNFKLQEVLKELISDFQEIDLKGYTFWTDELSILRSIQDAGYSLCLVANSSHPAKVRKILTDIKEGSESLQDLLTKVYISSEIGLTKPSISLMDFILTDLSVSKEDLVVIGDSLDVDIQWAQNSGVKCVWLNLAPTHKLRNVQCINEGTVRYPRSTISLNLVVETIQFYEPRGLKVGYFLPTSKKRILISKKKCFRSTESVWYNAIEMAANVDMQGEYDVLVHKCVDLMNAKSEDAQLVLKEFYSYIERHPEVAVIDSPQSFEVCSSRAAFTRLMIQHLGKGKLIHNTNVRVAWQAELDPTEENAISTLLAQLQANSVTYPLLIKTSSAINSAYAHTLSVVYNYEGLLESVSQYNESLIVQEFINHDATVYKVYSIGTDIRYYPRKSCANIKHITHNQVTFLSNLPWPEELKSDEPAIVHELDMMIVKEIVDMISSIAKVSMFGVDILIPSTSNDYVLVDMNPFPGYKEYTDLHILLDQHCLSTYEQHIKRLQD